MKTIRTIIVGVSLALVTHHHAFCADPLVAQVLGVTMIRECPEADVVARLIAEGQRIGADYTDVLPVSGQGQCPADYTAHVLVPLRSHVERTREGTLTTFVVSGGLTIGIHKRLQAERRD